MSLDLRQEFQVKDHACRKLDNQNFEALGRLLYNAYHGTIDDEGEAPEDAMAEAKNVIEGKYGKLLSECSFEIGDEDRLFSASVVTLFEGKPLLAFSITDPDFSRRGMAGALIIKSALALRSLGYSEMHLVVTEGNAPAENLYSKLGFKKAPPSDG